MARADSEFIPSGFFVLRTPLLPWDELRLWGDGARDAHAGDAPPDGEETDGRERERLRLHLTDVLARPEILEALFVASPDLVSAIDRWRRDPDGRRGRAIETSLVRYFLRMTGRPTPFGLFAGYSLGRVDSQTQLVVGPRSTYRRHTRPDMEYLCAFVAGLEREPKLRVRFLHRPNSSLYRAAGRVRYVEARTGGGARLFRLVAVESDRLLDAALSLAEGGIYPPQLAAALAERAPGLSHGDAGEFVDELIDGQILVSELSPSVTGDEPVESLLSKLAPHGTDSDVADRLRRCVAGLGELDARGLGNVPADYESVVGELAAVAPNVDARRLLQVDLMKPAPEASLGHEVVADIMKGVEILRQTFDAPRRDLSYFRSVFVERYGAGREVPLLEALDPDVGIAFALSGASPAGAPAAFPVEGQSAPQGRTWGKRDTHLLSLIQRSLADGTGQITLDPRDLEALRAGTPVELPDAFAVLASIAAPPEGGPSRGRFRVSIRNVQGPSGARLLGRFCHFDDELLRRTLEHIRAEEALRADALFAEIVHLPAGRTGNVLVRPRLRDYEIPYLGGSASPASRQIPVTDLLVTVIDRRVVLRSKSLRREIIPRLTAAHYYAAGGLDVYRFLCLLQDQGHAELEWDWGLSVHSPFLPRVCFQRLVLSRARWNLGADELRGLRGGSRTENVRAVRVWRAERKWPRWVAVVEDENELPVDLDNVLCIDTLAELLKGRESAQLVEVFPTPDELGVRGPEGRFAHEIVVPFVRANRPAAEVSSGTAQADAPTIKRTFAPGSEWLYFKLYTGQSTADQLLREFVRPLVNDVLKTGDAEQWFFIRYGDPFWHLRLRFRGSPERLHGGLLPTFNAAADAFMSAGKVWRVQLDTYEREVERYGGAEGIVPAERIFHADSEAVLTVVGGSAGNEGLEARRLIALRGVDRLLDDFALDLPHKLRAAQALCDEFGGRLSADRDFNNRVGAAYRNRREAVEGVVGGTGDMRAAFAREFAALERRSQQMSSAIAELKTLAEAGRLSSPLPRLISSLVHMHANRILRPAQRNEEALLYQLLVRFYRSQLARGRT